MQFQNQLGGRARFKMRSTGIVRKVDELGRIVLPIEMRRMLNISERDTIEIIGQDDGIMLKKYEPTCIFCSAVQHQVIYKGKHVCKECLKDLTAG